MKVININIGVPFQSFLVNLDDREFVLALRWNFRRSVWSMSVFDLDKTIIQYISSMLVNSNPNIVAVHNVDAPQGVFTIVDSAGESIEASLESLGDRHKLVFIPTEEYLTLTVG